jgi:hypothetical protein
MTVELERATKLPWMLQAHSVSIVADDTLHQEKQRNKYRRYETRSEDVKGAAAMSLMSR